MLWAITFPPPPEAAGLAGVLRPGIEQEAIARVSVLTPMMLMLIRGMRAHRCECDRADQKISRSGQEAAACFE